MKGCVVGVSNEVVALSDVIGEVVALRVALAVDTGEPPEFTMEVDAGVTPEVNKIAAVDTRFKPEVRLALVNGDVVN